MREERRKEGRGVGRWLKIVLLQCTRKLIYRGACDVRFGVEMGGLKWKSPFLHDKMSGRASSKTSGPCGQEK
eukprot:758634-Hanusia_phi.AAC.1